MSTQDMEQRQLNLAVDLNDEGLLMIPGPTRVPPEVRAVMTRQMISHRGPDFEELHADVTSRLTKLFHTQGDVVILPSSGTGALEAALVNVASPGDRILSCVMGAFGARFAAIAEAYGLDVERLDVEWGQAPDPDEIVARLQSGGKPFHAVLLTHCETSTGVLQPLDENIKAIRAVAPDVLILVDAVSSFAGAPLYMDEWNIDVTITASQKALMTPPGLGIVAVGPRAREAMAKAKLPRFTWDFEPYLKAPGKPPYTPAVGLWFGLQAALDSIEAEGEEALFARHRRMRDMTREGFQALGLRPLAPAEVASPTVTAAVLPEGIAPGTVLKLAREKGLVLAGAQGHLKDTVIRMGHMGGVQPEHITQAFKILEEIWADLPAAGVNR